MLPGPVLPLSGPTTRLSPFRVGRAELRPGPSPGSPSVSKIPEPISASASPEAIAAGFDRRVHDQVTPRDGNGDLAARVAPPAVVASAISIDELSRRPSRPPDHVAENRALVALAEGMAASPDSILQQLADTALTLCRAHSAGLSLLEEEDQWRYFHWRAVAGRWAPHLGGGTPRDFGPCGTVLDRNQALLFSHPERDFPYFGEVSPLLEEGLLIPFLRQGESNRHNLDCRPRRQPEVRRGGSSRHDQPGHFRGGGVPDVAVH